MAQIMLVTKNDDLRLLLASKLRLAGHDVVRVCDFDSALTILSEIEYDILLTSVCIDSSEEEIDFARSAQEIDPDMRIMFITGFSAVAIKRPGEKKSGDDPLNNPVHLINLPEQIDQLIAA